VDYLAKLQALSQKHDFFIRIDNDGCVFDSMEIKHEESFCPSFIKHLSLRSPSNCAQEIWDFVSPHSRYRGCNRFVASQTAHQVMSEWDAFITG
jgi:hypothetical protein